MCSRVSSVTLGVPFSARETDATDTRASLATSLIVTAIMRPRAGIDFVSKLLRPECKRFHWRLQKHCNKAVKTDFYPKKPASHAKRSSTCLRRAKINTGQQRPARILL